MAKHEENGEVFQTSPLMILLSYTALGAGLIAETILMSWELWAIPLIIGGILICWGLHITQFASARLRIWVYTVLMMASFFFYGIHVTSAFDMGLLMMIVIMIFTTAGEVGLIYVCQATYFVTLAYDVIVMATDGETIWDSLMISRTILHVGLIYLAGWLARMIMRRWSMIFGKSGEQIAELNESTNRMNSFMANLSHELRTPINAILGITNVMQDKEKDPENVKSMKEVIIAGNRMADQIGDILDYSEIEMDSLVVNEGDYMIASVLNDLVGELRPIMQDHLELVIDVDAEIPAVIRGDAMKLRKILYHLINNGLKYTKEGGVYVKLSTIKQSYGINLCIEVTDTGVGMTKDELDRIYNRFYQADSGREIRSGGLGISMVIVSGFVRALGGFMTIDSQKGEGTTVRVSIPQKIVDEDRCMQVGAKITLGAYLNFGKFANPNVREFYNRMIVNLVRGLRTTMHRVDNVADLKKLLERVELTHLFVADEEYEQNREYLETLAKRMQVVVVARESFELPKNSRAQIMAKPFYCIPVVTVLNTEKKDSQPRLERMRCDGVKALVVDDEPMNLSVAKGLLKRYGMEVKTANSGEEAIQSCRENEYDIIFMDHMMPGMDGVEAMKRIRYNGVKGKNGFTIVALTANALSTAREMFIAEGFDGFISKPIELAEFERVLKRVLPKNLVSYEVEGEVVEYAPAEEVQEFAPAEEVVEFAPTHESVGVSEASEKAVDYEMLLQEGIDTNLGLKYCEQDEELYQSLLAQYCAEAEEKKEKLRDFLSAKDLKNYTIVVHALKSSSRMIGAESLSEKAKALEAAAKAEDQEFIDGHHDEMMKEYDLVTMIIRKAMKTEAVQEEEVFEYYPGGEEG
ncbi:MAG: response regulator [Lachnospiraceae bacterium]|nr:response regulator [Lachnospiraceae bacterium]